MMTSTSKSLIWAIGLCILPNIPFLLLNIAFSWDRTGIILAYFGLTLFALIDFRLPRLNRIYRIAAVILFALVNLFDILNFIMRFFALRLSELLYAIPAMFELEVLTFLPYVGICIGFLANFVIFAFVLARAKRLPFRYAGLITAVFAALFAADVAGNFQANYKIEAGDSILRLFTGVEEKFIFQSATGQSRFETVLQNDNHVLVVIVEAWGVFQDDALNKRLLAPLRSAAMGRKYQFETGNVNYLGSTTAAELREFCQSRKSYAALLSKRLTKVETCLPARAKAAGYQTTALHGFAKRFFGRNVWYPKIGITAYFAREDFLAGPNRRRIRQCGGTFKGVCDKFVAAKLQAILAAAEQKQFLYWLTLNSHPPSRRAQGFGRPFPCAEFAGLDAQSCIMAEYWTEVFENIAKIALKPGRRGLDILLVGDHAPPLLTRSARASYRPGIVPYMVLRQKP